MELSLPHGYSYIGIGKYLGCVKIFPLVASGGAGHLNVNLGSLLSWKLLELESEIKNTIRCGKVLASGTKIIILYDTT